VVVSDDLVAPGFRALSPGERAVTFLHAGGDLVLVGDTRRASTMAAALLQRAAQEPAFARALTGHATRVLEMKAAHGLAGCRRAG